MSSKILKVTWFALLGGLILFSFFVLSTNIFYCIPHTIPHPDVLGKFSYFNALMGMGIRGGCSAANPVKMGYVTIDYYVYMLLKGLLSNFKSINVSSHALNFWGIVSFMRVMSVIYGVLAVLFTVILARMLFNNRWVALLGGLLLAIHPVFILYSHTALGEVPSSMFSVLAFIFAIRIYRYHKPLDYILSAVFAGLSASCEIYGGMVFLMPLIAHFMGNKDKKWWQPFLSGKLYLLFFFSLIGFGIGIPSLFFFPRNVILKVLGGISHGFQLFTSSAYLPLFIHPAYASSGGHNYIFQKYFNPYHYWIGLKTFLGSMTGTSPQLDERWILYSFRTTVEIIYLIFLGIGLFFLYRAKKYKKEYMLLFVYVVLYIVIFVIYRPHYLRPRDTSDLLPYVALVLTYFICVVCRHLYNLRLNRYIKVALIGLILVFFLMPKLYDGMSVRYVFSIGETRELARDWWYNNIPRDSKVAMEVGSPPSFVDPKDYQVIGYGGWKASSGYIITDERVNYKPDYDRILIKKYHYIPVKSFCLIFLNMWMPDVHILKADTKDILPSLLPPMFAYRGLKTQKAVFYNRRDVNIDEDVLVMKEWEGGKFVIVSPHPVEKVGILLTGRGSVRIVNGSFSKDVELGGEIDIHKHKDRLVIFTPQRRYPTFKYFYEVYLQNTGHNVFFAKLLTKPKDIARYLLQFKRYKEASRILEDVIKKSKYVAPEEYINLMKAYYGLNDYKKAIETYKKLVAKYPDFMEKAYSLCLQEENTNWYSKYKELMNLSDEWMKWNVRRYGVKDIQAKAGRVVIAGIDTEMIELLPDRDRGKIVHLWLPELFHRGFYRVYFRIKGGAGAYYPPDKVVGIFDVPKHYCWRVYGFSRERVIRAEDLKEDKWKDIALGFRLGLEIGGLELRFRYKGGIPVYISGFELIPDYRRTLIEFNRDVYKILADSYDKTGNSQTSNLYSNKLKELN